jgi:hypothetical protein
MKYARVERALAKLFNVEPASLGALRARLRHLRNIGTPELPRPGSGRQIEYTRDHVIEIMIALEFELIGVSPRHSAVYAKMIRSTIAGGNPETYRGLAILLTSVGQAFDTPWQAVSVVNLHTWAATTLREHPARRFAVIDIAQALETLDAALDRE